MTNEEQRQIQINSVKNVETKSDHWVMHRFNKKLRRNNESSWDFRQSQLFKEMKIAFKAGVMWQRNRSGKHF